MEHQRIYRRLTAQERARHAEIRGQVEHDKPQMARRALARKAELLAGFAAMQQLKRAREAAGLSLADVATRSGIDKASLSRLENDPNTNPTIGTLTRVARALGVNLTVQVTPAA